MSLVSNSTGGNVKKFCFFTGQKKSCLFNSNTLKGGTEKSDVWRVLPFTAFTAKGCFRQWEPKPPETTRIGPSSREYPPEGGLFLFEYAFQHTHTVALVFICPSLVVAQGRFLCRVGCVCRSTTKKGFCFTNSASANFLLNVRTCDSKKKFFFSGRPGPKTAS